MRITAEPRSDQLNYDDFIGIERDYTISDVIAGKAEAKYDIRLEGENRAWRPPLTVIRLLIKAWGDEGDRWIGRRVRLFGDETVRFGSDVTGGIRVSHMSHLPGDKPLKEKVTLSRGKRAVWTIQPLQDTATPPPAISPITSPVTPAQIEACTNEGQLREWWQASDDATRAIITERVQILRHEQEASQA